PSLALQTEREWTVMRDVVGAGEANDRCPSPTGWSGWLADGRPKKLLDKTAYRLGLVSAEWEKAAMVKILLLQGANLTFLGRREPEIYGSTTPAELEIMLQCHAHDHAYQLEIFYTNIEGED